MYGCADVEPLFRTLLSVLKIVQCNIDSHYFSAHIEIPGFCLRSNYTLHKCLRYNLFSYFVLVFIV